MSPSRCSTIDRYGRVTHLAFFALLLSTNVAFPQERWLEAERPFRVALDAPSGNNRRRGQVVAARIDWKQLFVDSGVSRKISPASFKLYELKDDGPEPVSCDYVDGSVVWRLSGTTTPLTVRTYCLYFDIADREPEQIVGRVLQPGEKPPGVNLVRNGDFETPVADDWAGPTGWEIEKPFDVGSEVLVSPGDGVDGSTGLRLRTKLVGDRHRVECACDFFPVKPGTKYFGGANIKLVRSEKGIDGSGSATMFLQFYRTDKSRDWRQRTMAGAKFVSGQWDDVSRRIGMVAPSDSAWARVHLSAGWYGPAEAVFDDIFVAEASKGGAIEIRIGRLKKKP